MIAPDLRPGLERGAEWHDERADTLLGKAAAIVNRAAANPRASDASEVAALIDEASVHQVSAEALRRLASEETS